MSLAVDMPLFAPRADDAPIGAERPFTLDVLQDDHAIPAILRERAAGRRSTVLAMATGTGKTVVAAKMVKAFVGLGLRVLFVVDERRLAFQAADKFRAWGVEAAVEMAELKATDHVLLHGLPSCVVTTRQSFASRLDRHDWSFDVVFIDEAHCGIKGGQLRRIRAAFPSAFEVLLSATPYFSDGKTLVPHHAESIAFEYPMEDYPDGRKGAISNGHLVPPEMVECDAGVDLTGLKMSKGQWGNDYSAGELEERLSAKLDVLANSARMELQKNGFYRALCPTPDVASGIHAAKAFRAIGLRAEAVYGDHPDADGVFRRYESGGLDVLCGCNMFVKGFDDQPTDAIVWMRPTRSYPLARQILGRGVRLSPATGKKRCLVVGFAWVADKQPVSVLDIFLQGLPDPRLHQLAQSEYRKRAKKGPVDIAKLLDRAKDRQQKEEEEKKRKARDGWGVRVQRRDVKYRRREVVPFRFSADAPLQQLPAFDPGQPATAEQLVRLAEVGYRNAKGMSGRAAEDVLRKWEGRREAGMSSYAQWQYMRRLDPGVQESAALGMTSGEAGHAIDQLKRGQGR